MCADSVMHWLLHSMLGTCNVHVASVLISLGLLAAQCYGCTAEAACKLDCDGSSDIGLLYVDAATVVECEYCMCHSQPHNIMAQA